MDGTHRSLDEYATGSAAAVVVVGVVYAIALDLYRSCVHSGPALRALVHALAPLEDSPLRLTVPKFQQKPLTNLHAPA